jgi:hypothetical protein
VSGLTDLAGILAELLDAADQAQRQKAIEGEASALERLVEGLIAEDPEVRRTGPDSIHRGDADLIYLASVTQLDTRRVLEEAEREITTLGGTFRTIESPVGTLARFRAATASSSIRGWVVPQRGWLLLVSAPDQAEADAFASLLDHRLEADEGRSS